MGERSGFGESTARSKVGRRVRILGGFSSVRKGTTGVVTGADPGRSGYTVAVEWELADRRTGPRVTWFTQDEYEKFLVET